MTLSIVMPCLNEADTLGVCIQKASAFLTRNNLEGEIIVADNGSTDASVAIAQKLGARVVAIASRGYGAALQGGIAAAQGKHIVMGDADDSYDFSNLESFTEKLNDGFDLVMGNRFKGGIEKGAMPFLHRYLGNPVLTFVGRLFFRSPVGDFHCGLRAVTREAFQKMNLNATGMEFASEMVVKATMYGMNIGEVPTMLSKDGRNRPPHLKTWRDGWRHLRFLFMYAPRWFLFYPGLLLLVVSVIMGSVLALQPLQLFQLRLDVHTLLYTMGTALLGTQLLFLYSVVKRYISRHIFSVVGIAKRRLSLEKSLLMGGALLITGIILSFCNVGAWGNTGFGELQPALFMRRIIPEIFLICVGFQTMANAFVLALINDQ